jgi:uncharacterized membrane protein YhaH (DUF805 family)
MEPTNPYRSPTADTQPLSEGGSDQTPPYSPAGRFGRLSYLAWVTIVSVIGQLIMLIAGGGAVMGLPGDVGEAAIPDIGMGTMVIYLIVALAVLVLTILFAVRRCHDMDISGWWNLLILVPLVNLVYGLFLVLKPGTEGPNRFGPPRLTPGWEKVVGIIGIVLMVVAVIGVLVSLAIPAYMGLTGAGGPAGVQP